MTKIRDAVERYADIMTDVDRQGIIEEAIAHLESYHDSLNEQYDRVACEDITKIIFDLVAMSPLRRAEGNNAYSTGTYKVTITEKERTQTFYVETETRRLAVDKVRYEHLFVEDDTDWSSCVVDVQWIAHNNSA